MAIETTGDILPADEVEPSGSNKFEIIAEALKSGEILIRTRDGKEFELHEYDTHLFPMSETIYTQEDDNDQWIFADEVVSIERHYH